MATEPSREQYVDLPYTNFPASEDNHARMSDVGADTIDLVTRFNSYYNQQNWNACTQLLADHPELENCMFDAEKFNFLRDAIIALQRFYLNDVSQMLNDARNYINQLENVKVGIDDSTAGHASYFTTYSANKLENMYGLDYHVSDTFIKRWEGVS